MTSTHDIVEARQRADALRASLPPSVDVVALGVRSKAPFQLLCAREALIWRTEELARTACDALERSDLTVAAILTRAVIESAALAWMLKTILAKREQYSPQQMNDQLMRVLMGTKSWPDMPQPFHVLACIDQLDKEVPGFRKSYDLLSEIAHPNWAGAAGLYAKNDEVIYVTTFGRDRERMRQTEGMVANALLGALGLFEFAYNKISDAMPAFLQELESLRLSGQTDGPP
jgi:hypothetical protein